MTTSKSATFAALVAALVLGSGGIASAAPAAATAGVNVRTGPGSSYGKVDVLPKGEYVNITECKSGWCFVEHDGNDGWVAGNYLDKSPPPNPDATKKSPDVNVNVNIDKNGKLQLGLELDTGKGKITIGAGSSQSRICFYENSNYAGQDFCVNAGATDTSLSGFWNDRIESIALEGGATVTVCRHASYGGYCRTYSKDQANLPPFLKDNISSFKSY